MDPSELVRRGYDMVSHAYRGDVFDPADDPYYERLADLLLRRLAPGSHVLDLGCGCGIPAARDFAELHHVTGVDISPIQIDRARALVPAAEFVCADMTDFRHPPARFDAVVSLYAIIHVPLDEQHALFERIRGWLKPGGWLLCVVGHKAWTGTEKDWLGVAGATMFWSHADAETYEGWLAELGFRLAAKLFIPEGPGGHVALLAETPAGE